MKKIFLFFLVCGTFVFSSCSNDAFEKGVNSAEDNTPSTLDITTNSEFKAAMQALAKAFEKETRTGKEMSAGDAKEIMSPFVGTGKSVRTQLLQTAEQYIAERVIDESDMIAVEKMSDEQLSVLGFVVTVVHEGPDFFEADTQYSIEEVAGCIFQAVGIYVSMEEFGSILSAKVAWEIAKKAILKYSSWIGAAAALYDFANCMGLI